MSSEDPSQHVAPRVRTIKGMDLSIRLPEPAPPQDTWRPVSQLADAHPAHIALARAFGSVKIMGPPLSDELIALVSHLYSIEEAEVCHGLTFLYPRPLPAICRITGHDPSEELSRLEVMAQRRVIHKVDGRYMLYPLIPGIFEYVFMTGQDSPWHAEYARLINDLFGTGYIRDYLSRDIGAVRNIPLQKAIEHKNYVVDSDLISNLLDAHSKFAVLHHCPCRHSKALIGRPCKRATAEDGCLIFGEFSATTVANGNGRPVDRVEMREVIHQRWEKKLVFLTANVNPSEQNVICTCCDCCCHALETANRYSNHFIASPHFIVAVDESLCNNCGRCVRACNSYAHVMDDRKHVLQADRCIGCGHCVDVCRKQAIHLVENPKYEKASSSYLRLLMRMLPPILLMGAKIKLSRWFDNTPKALGTGSPGA